eukprot:8409158-Pyramimonas_sp.AAC.1
MVELVWFRARISTRWRPRMNRSYSSRSRRQRCPASGRSSGCASMESTSRSWRRTSLRALGWGSRI